MKKPRSTIIGASEIKQWDFCPMQWWLIRNGAKSDSAATRRGVAYHDERGKAVKAITVRQNILKYAWIGVAICCCFLFFYLR